MGATVELSNVQVNDIRIAFMILSLLVFVGVTWWAYSPRRRSEFKDAGRYILDDNEDGTYTVRDEGSPK
jgi:cytochrome c oxidase cbb3-type subunit IV